MSEIKLDRHEANQLRSIGGSVYGSGKIPYWWGQGSMPKLANRGFVEPHPDHPKAWRITDAGRAFLQSETKATT